MNKPTKVPAAPNIILAFFTSLIPDERYTSLRYRGALHLTFTIQHIPDLTYHPLFMDSNSTCNFLAFSLHVLLFSLGLVSLDLEYLKSAAGFF